MTSTSRRPSSGWWARRPVATSGTSGPQVGRSAISEPFDLDALAGAYVHRPLSVDAARRARRAVDGLGAADIAVDVGGGTGRHAAEWAQLGVRAIVADPSPAMGVEAAAHQGVVAVGARSEALPFRDSSCQLVYFHLSIHYGDWRAALDEAWRVLAPGGQLVVWTLGEDHHRQALIMRYFPQLLEVDLQRFPDPEALALHVERLGSRPQLAREVETKQMSVQAWTEAVRARFISTLQLLTPDELDEGLARFTADHPETDTIVEYSLLYSGLVARR